MTQGKSTQPSQALARRLRSLIAGLDEASVDSTAKQVSGWIDSFKDQGDRLRGLLRLSAELILEKVMERPDKDLHRALGRFCKILDTVTEGEYSGLLNMLWKEEIQAAGIELLANDVAPPGSWPEYLALITFAGEVCDDGLLQPDDLRDCARMLGGLGSNLGLELACTLLETTGQSLREDCHGEHSFDTIIQGMLSASKGDGISARTRNRVQELAAQWDLGLTHPTKGSGDAQWDNETAIWDAEEARLARQVVLKLCKPKHPKFYFGSGDTVFVCEDTSFRVQADLLSRGSGVLAVMLESNWEHLSDGCPCVHLSDTVDDFVTLLSVFYTSMFPRRHKTPDFATFSSLLRMTTKYQFQEIKSQILLDLHPAYPTELSKYEGSSCLGEEVFGTPVPHPNSVLDLLVKSEVAFALPFAYYRVCIAGDPASLETTDAEAALPPDTLKAALRGQARLKAEEIQLARKVIVQDCPSWGLCTMKSPAGRTQIFDWIFPQAATRSGILEKGEPPESGYCFYCRKTFKRELSKAKEDTWKNLPTYFDLPPWKNPANIFTWFFSFF